MKELWNHSFAERDVDEIEAATLLSEAETRQMQRRKRSHISLVLLHWMLTGFLLTTTLYFMKKSSEKPVDLSQGVYSPAHEVIEYETKVFHKGFQNGTTSYQGWPTDEIDALWSDMYSKGVTLHIDEQSHAQIPKKSEHVPVSGYENEYLVGIDVFHQLHCLNMIRKAFYPSRYNISFFNEDGTVNYLEWMHLDHCIESIRQSLTCNADISTFHYRWLEKSKYMQAQMDSVHTCRNFDKIRDWAFDHYVDKKASRSRVENGRIVDYSSWGPDPTQENIDPEDFHHTRDEFLS